MDPRIEAARNLIQQHYAQRLTASAVARQSGLSRSRFEHLFKQESGLTFKAYLQALRVTKAKELLADWRLSIKQVAARVGYAHPPDLTRAFREQLGITPSEYRKRLTPVPPQQSR